MVSLSSGFHPQTNSQMECTNQDLEPVLHCVVEANHTIWSFHLPWIEYSHNSLTCSATGLSPFKISLGYHSPDSRPRMQTWLCPLFRNT